MLSGIIACQSRPERPEPAPEQNSLENASDEVVTNPINIKSGELTRFINFKSDYVRDRNVDVWEPFDYDPGKYYPVIYMHDGQMLFDSSNTWNGQEWQVDEIITALIDSGIIEPCIIVGIWNIKDYRHNNYFPQKSLDYLDASFRETLDTMKRGEKPLLKEPINSDAYLKFITKELKPYIDQKFPTLSDAEHTYIAGSSMGGLISMYAMLEYPEVFSAAACISTHWPGVMPMENNPIPEALRQYLADNMPKPEKHRIYFDFGTETLDASYEPHQAAVDSTIRALGYNEDLWESHKFEGAAHDEISWAKRLHIPIRFLLNK
jgi:enterochelin esterase-like enzyme